MEIRSERRIDEYIAKVTEAGLPHSAFSSSGFLETWWEYHGANLDFLGLLGYREDQLVASLPLYRPASRMCKAWRVVGDTLFNVVWIPALESCLRPFLESALAYLATADRSGGLIVSDVPSGGELFEILRSRGKTYRLYECPFVNIAGNWPDVYPGLLSKKRSAEVRRGKDRLCKAGSVSHLIIDSSNGELLAQLLPDCVRLHEERFKGTTNTSGFSDSRYTKLYETLLSRMCLEDDAWLSIILLDGLPISFILGFIQGNTFIDAIPAFDPAFAKFGLGHVHIAMLLEELNRRGIEMFDFSKGNSVYKQKWASGSTDQYTIMVPTGMTPSVDLCVASMLVKLKTFGRERHINSRIKQFLAQIKQVGFRKDADPSAVPIRDVDSPNHPLEWRLISSYKQMMGWPTNMRLAVMDDFYSTTTWASFAESCGIVHVRLANGLTWSFGQ